MNDPYCVRQVKLALVIGSILVVGSCIGIGVALSDDAIPALNTKADIEWAVNELVKIHDFCFQHEGCAVIPKDIRSQELLEIEGLRRRVKELETGRCA